MKHRDSSLDIAKGIAIIAIVAGHVVRGIGNAGLVSKDAVGYLLVDRAIYSFHLAVFALAAGFVVKNAVEKRGATSYTRRRLADFAWLYILWSLLQGSLQVLLAGSVNNGQSWASVFDLIHPDSHMWFFPWIALCCTFVAFTRPWVSPMRAVIIGGGALVLSVAVWGLFGPVIFLQGHGLSGYFVVATIISLGTYQYVRSRCSIGVEATVGLVAGGAWLTLMVYTPAAGPTYSKLVRTAPNIAVSVLATTLGVVAVLAVSALLSRFEATAKPLAYVGRYSLQIFLAHVLAMAATRIVLVKLGVTDVTVHVVLGTAVGTLVPLVLWHLTKVALPWLWRAPFALSGGH
ncbi:acyltransferase family protein [Schaalia suimastitidis]|uniref:acyltransferase family protein n=1 Tax=Schaalia suimastitidis TaxID=121163 RepID=UPI00040F5669|nr:acyltransferase [Schaalia suimastitidis]